ncbi:hypothetical protein QAO71_17975 (plasmid) [Halopseudomonas sp. SMJS2]|uniref:hypothetical protein n=1 Tax=Halopseudomonas sp. SMJS2 TaxID=3041098 RepID=UPI002452C16D|nr:hypothetical protein [Halopseudomonas sp. SMJS2]WGK63430.1 hypothetical protein QAO71_17975 [Halopseudomonas sp. SMJS2]
MNFNVSRGLLLQLLTWHRDVWSEILLVTGTGDDQIAHYLRYDLMGNKRWVESAPVASISTTKHSLFLSVKERRSGSIHLNDGRSGANQRAWNRPVNLARLPTRLNPERYVPHIHGVRRAAG